MQHFTKQIHAYALTLTLYMSLAGTCYGQITIIQAQVQNYQSSANFAQSVANAPQPSYIKSMPQAELDALTKAFPGWNFAPAGTLNGILTIDSYKATASSSRGGAEISLHYAPQGPGGNPFQMDPALGSLFWIQMVTTDSPLPGDPNPTVDPSPGGTTKRPADKLPFYWDIILPQGGNRSFLDPSWRKNGLYYFDDGPGRPWPTPPPQGGTVTGLQWQANLYLAYWDGNVTVNIYDGVGWSWYLQQYPTP